MSLENLEKVEQPVFAEWQWIASVARGEKVSQLAVRHREDCKSVAIHNFLLLVELEAVDCFSLYGVLNDI